MIIKHHFFSREGEIELNTVNTSQPFVTKYIFSPGWFVLAFTVLFLLLCKDLLLDLTVVRLRLLLLHRQYCRRAQSHRQHHHNQREFGIIIIDVLKVTASIIMIVIISIIRERLLSLSLMCSMQSPASS